MSKFRLESYCSNPAASIAMYGFACRKLDELYFYHIANSLIDDYPQVLKEIFIKRQKGNIKGLKNNHQEQEELLEQMKNE